MWGDLATVMAAGLRGKRLGEAQRYERDQDLLANVQAGDQRAEERKRYQAQQERLAAQDTRQASRDALMNPLDLEMARAELADFQAKAAGTGRYAPQPVQRPWEKAGFADADSFYQHERRLAGSRRDPAARSRSAPLDVAAEDKRRMALIARGNAAIGQLPKDPLGKVADPEMARRIGETTDSIASEIGAPAPAVRGNPFDGLRMPGQAGVVAPPGQAPAVLDAAIVSTLQRELRSARLSGMDAVQFLREEGFSDAEIRQIVGAGGG